MWVRMRHFISGGRADDRPWPDGGGVIEVPDPEGEDLIRGQLADPAPAPKAPEPAKAAEEKAAEPEAAEATEPPSARDPKAAWINWAISQGANWDDASRATKEELQRDYGGRL